MHFEEYQITYIEENTNPVIYDNPHPMREINVRVIIRFLNTQGIRIETQKSVILANFKFKLTCSSTWKLREFKTHVLVHFNLLCQSTHWANIKLVWIPIWQEISFFFFQMKMKMGENFQVSCSRISLTHLCPMKTRILGLSDQKVHVSNSPVSFSHLSPSETQILWTLRWKNSHFKLLFHLVIQVRWKYTHFHTDMTRGSGLC